MSSSSIIESPADQPLDELVSQLGELADGLDQSVEWPAAQLDLCGRYGVFEWFIPRQHGGQEWSQQDIVRGYLRLSSACLTTTFILTQRTGACRRIASSSNEWAYALLPRLATNELFASVGISHLTTSRRHLSRPVLLANETGSDYVLQGFSPWVTGGIHCDFIVTGATLEDGRQLLAVVPTDVPGVSCLPPAPLIGLNSSHTGRVVFDGVRVERRWLLAGPEPNVMSSGKGANTGGLETSTLALGLASAAVAFLRRESGGRPDLSEAAERLEQDLDDGIELLLAAADNDPRCTTEVLRARSNSLALRSTQAALTAAKGAGYIVGHPVGRWCREALFFLVWSCPQPVAKAALCELAAIEI